MTISNSPHPVSVTSYGGLVITAKKIQKYIQCTVKPVYVVTSIKQSPQLSSHLY